MQDFEYYTPTHVVFGKHAVERVGELITGQNGKKVLIHYGGGSAKRSGLLDRVTDALEQSGISYVMLGGVVPNPRLGLVREGIALCKREGVDFILAVGGGSVIDSSKAIAYGIANDGDVWDFYAKKRVPKACAPVGTILTIAAAGSEMSNSSVITNEDGWLKRGLSTELCRCKFAIMDPTLTYTLPAYQTASGAADVMMHTMERYFTKTKDVDLTDRIAEGLLKSVIEAGKVVAKDPCDYEARATLMWAGSLSHNDLTGAGREVFMSIHQMEHELSGMDDTVAHGAGLSALFGSWARYVCKYNVERFAQFAVRVWNCEMDFENPEATALAGIEAMENYYRSIGMPTNLRELGFVPDDACIEEMAEKCTFFGSRTLNDFIPLYREDIAAIYRAARE